MPLFITKSNSKKPTNADLKNNGFPIAFADDGNHIWISNNGSEDTDVKTFHTEKLSANGTVDGTHTPASGFTIDASKDSTSKIVTGLEVDDHNITVQTGTLTFNKETSVVITPETASAQSPGHGGSFNIISNITTDGTNGHTLKVTTKTVKMPEHSSHTLSATGKSINLSGNGGGGSVTLQAAGNLTISDAANNIIKISSPDVSVTAPSAPSATSKGHESNNAFSFVTGISASGHGITYTMEKIYIASDNSHAGTHTLSSDNNVNSIKLSGTDSGGEVTFSAGDGITISGGANNITITNSKPDINHDTHSKHTLVSDNNVNSIKLTGDNSSGEVTFSAGDGITISGGKDNITITNSKPNTHYETHLYVGKVDTSSNSQETDPYIKLYDGSIKREQHKIIGGGATSVASDSNGNILIGSSNTHAATHSFSWKDEGSNGNYVVVELSGVGANGIGSTNFQVDAGRNVTVIETGDGFEISSENTHRSTHSASIRYPAANVVDLLLSGNGNNGSETSDLWQFRGTGATTVSASDNGKTIRINTPDVVKYGSGTANSVGPVHKIEVVSSLPSTKNANTLYLVV